MFQTQKCTHVSPLFSENTRVDPLSRPLSSVLGIEPRTTLKSLFSKLLNRKTVPIHILLCGSLTLTSHVVFSTNYLNTTCTKLERGKWID